MTKTKIFFDTEFTGLHQNTTLISIGLVSECGKTLYCEFSDYDKKQLNPWLEENVISKLSLKKKKWTKKEVMANITKEENGAYYGNTKYIAECIEAWLSQFDEVEMWSDCLAYDWVLFCEMYGGAFGIPKNIYYIPFDICTLFKIKGIDTDISREKFAGVKAKYIVEGKHSAIFDAIVLKDCYTKLMR